MFTTDQARAALDGTVYTTGGDKVGKVGQIFLDNETDQPEWVTVATGLFGSRESFVPLSDAQLEGDRIVVPYDTDKIKNAPQVDAEAGQISEQEEATLYSYYERSYTQAPAQTAVTDTTTTTVAPTTTAATTAPATDDAMTRSEERLKVGTVSQEVGRARLRKYIVTEQQTVTVPVTREEVQVVSEPITDANVGDATSGATLTEAEHEVTLHAERAVVDKEVVPVERVRLDTQTVTAQETVTEEVRKEQIETDAGDTSIDLRGERSSTERTV